MKLELPCIIVNFKSYEQTIGDKGLSLVKKMESVFEDTGANMYICPQTVDLRVVTSMSNLKVLSQHADPKPFGAYTGSVTLVALKDVGVIGTLLNHSEKRIDKKTIKLSVEEARKLGIISIVCCPNLDWIKDIAKIKPDIIAYEPPELIGGNVSVSSAKPEIIEKGVELCGKIPMLVGAGVKTGEDVKRACELGARGILVASGVVKANNPEKALFDFIDALE